MPEYADIYPYTYITVSLCLSVSLSPVLTLTSCQINAKSLEIDETLLRALITLQTKKISTYVYALYLCLSLTIYPSLCSPLRVSAKQFGPGRPGINELSSTAACNFSILPMTATTPSGSINYNISGCN